MNNYEPLYRTLQKRNMSMRTLSIEIGFFPTSLCASVNRKENLTTLTISKICKVLDCKPEDIVQIVPDGTVIEHKRTCCQAKREREGIVSVNWEKLESLIESKGYNNSTLSEAVGKNRNFIAVKKKKKHNSIEFLNLITSYLGADYKDYVL